MHFLDYLEEKNIVFEPKITKNEMLERLARGIPDHKVSIDKNEILNLLYKRETLMSTGIGMGLGIPHARSRGIVSPVVMMGISSGGLADYDTIDGSLVRIVFMILLEELQHKAHIEILAGIVRTMKSHNLVEQIASMTSAAEVLKTLKSQD
jgi:PTS system nitrogen regulatory IIA component